ncbi:MAG: hypothetical protein HYX69_03000 [Planctomycetia bacterium]|nr:hypothetical protein [Planctomycetia bacterium]
MKSRRFISIVSLLLAAVAQLPLAVAARAADDVQPSHQCLPDETVLVMRVPEGRRFVEAFRNQTKLGAVLLSQKRFDAIVELIREQAGEGLNKFTAELAKYGLKTEDFPKLFDKELGFALAIEQRSGQFPLAVGLWWAEPEGDLAQRIVAALQQAIDEQKSQPNAARRVDLDLEGQQVMHLAMPVMGPELAEEGVGTIDFQNLTEEQIKAKVEERARRAADAKQIEVDQFNVFIARVGQRLLVAHTFPQSQSETRKHLADNPGKAPDFAAITGVEQAKGVFARFLKAHTSGGSGLTPRVMATPGLAAALPDGVPLIEILGLPEPLLKWAQSADSPLVANVLKTLGVDRIGPAALRVALDRGALRTGFFLSAPEPRKGLLTLLDQQTFTPDAPPWVPATALGYSQLSLDLGKLYTSIRDMVVEQFGDQVRQPLDMVEQQIRSVTQTDVATLLSSVGSNHYFVTFDPTITKIEGNAVPGLEMPSTRTGIVWDLKDEAPWKRLIQMGAGLAALSEGAVTASEEQGFTGLRLKVENIIEGGVFVGHGHMVLGIGPNVVEPLMSAIRNPPEGSAALKGGDLMKRAGALLPPEPCIYYQMMDFDRYVKTLRQTVVTMLELPLTMRARLGAVAPGAGDDQEGQKLVAKIKELIPNEEELEGTSGVAAGQLIVNGHGLLFRSAIELPAP